MVTVCYYFKTKVETDTVPYVFIVHRVKVLRGGGREGRGRPNLEILTSNRVSERARRVGGLGRLLQSAALAGAGPAPPAPGPLDPPSHRSGPAAARAGAPQRTSAGTAATQRHLSAKGQ